ETNRLFIVEKKGRIVVVTNLAAPTRTIFIDISSRVISSADTTVSGEEGCLGLAFHPGYATNGYFYVFYTGNATTSAGTGHHDILSRFSVSVSNPNQGDAASEVRFILQYDEASNHNAGDLHFGADGYLYVSLGDEGGAYGQYGNTQLIDRDFFSAIMRLDVDRRPGSLTPHAHAALSAPTNFVWTPPLVQYGHTNGRNCIIGGVVSRGYRLSQLYGAYLYADYGSGEIWVLRHSGTNVTQNSTILTNSGAAISAFGVDPSN